MIEFSLCKRTLNGIDILAQYKLQIIISAKCKRSEHWRRLWDWSFCPSVCVFVVTSLDGDMHSYERFILFFWTAKVQIPKETHLIKNTFCPLRCYYYLFFHYRYVLLRTWRAYFISWRRLVKLFVCRLQHVGSMPANLRFDFERNIYRCCRPTPGRRRVTVE